MIHLAKRCIIYSLFSLSPKIQRYCYHNYSFSWWIILSQILDNINNTSMNVFIQVSFFFWVLSSLHIFNFSKKNAKVFQWSSTNVHSHQQGMRISVVLELHQHLRASVFFHFINTVNVLSYLPMLDCSNVNCLYWEIHGSWLKVHQKQHWDLGGESEALGITL